LQTLGLPLVSQRLAQRQRDKQRDKQREKREETARKIEETRKEWSLALKTNNSLSAEHIVRSVDKHSVERLVNNTVKAKRCTWNNEIGGHLAGYSAACSCLMSIRSEIVALGVCIRFD